MIIFAQTNYYWYQGNKINLTENPNLFYISSTDSLGLVKASFYSGASITSVKEKGSFTETQKRYWQIVEIKSNSIIGALPSASILASDVKSDIIYVAPVYGTSTSTPVATSEYFYVQLKSAGDYSVLQSQANNYGCRIVKQIEYMPLWYILQAPRYSNGVSMANMFYETSKFQATDPAFMFNFRPTCVSDLNFSQQWGLKNSNGIDINACNAWSITKGNSSVMVAVLDQGIDQNHKEFASNYSSLSYDLHTLKSPSVLRGNHGTHVGGIIGANHNGIQVAGVAPNATLLSISHGLSITPNLSAELATGFGYARDKGAAVMNNSWGDQGGAYYDYMRSAVLEDAIRSAITSGRGGKGMVVVFASGNYNRALDYPANCNSDILVVGSIESSGQKSSFSSYGTGLDVVAPGGNILSTLPYNAIGNMSGTSMAAPHVAGVAALLLSVNPNLTGKQVKDAIESSARKVGGYSYTTNMPNGTWNTYMGYGLVDAHAALLKVQSCTSTDYSNKTVSTTTTVTCNNITSSNVTVSNGATLILKGSQGVILNPLFTVNAGSMLELKNN